MSAFPIAMTGCLLVVFETIVRTSPSVFVGTPDDRRRFIIGMILLRLIGFFLIFYAVLISLAQ